MPPEGVKVLGLAKTVILDKPLIIWRIVSHHEGRLGIETVYQQAQFVIKRRIGRPAEFIDALIGKPLPYRVEKTGGGFLIVAALEKAEKTAALVIMHVVALVENGRYPPANFIAASGDKGLHRIPGVKRMGHIAN